MSGFTYVSLFTGLDYSVTNAYNADVEGIMDLIDSIHNELIELEGRINGIFGGT